jgi:hypothetical protein
MEYNTCGTCGAKDGRAGLLIGSSLNNDVPECGNCYDTRESGSITIHTNLVRTDEEIQKTMGILTSNKLDKNI